MIDEAAWTALDDRHLTSQQQPARQRPPNLHSAKSNKDGVDTRFPGTTPGDLGDSQDIIL